MSSSINRIKKNILEKLYAIIDKENFEPGGTLEERVSVLEEVLQDAVMATTNEDEGATR